MMHVLVITQLLDRSIWLAIGAALGFALGYMVRAKREAHEALQKMDEFLLAHQECPVKTLKNAEEREDHQ